MLGSPAIMENGDTPTLGSLDSEAHIWLTGPVSPEAAEDHLPLLVAEEVEQYERFLVDRPRYLYLAARALARSVLSIYAPDVDPAAWRFRFNEHGRPEIDGPADQPPLRFNLSHTDGLVACMVTLEMDTGVDVEWTERGIDLVGVAGHSFSELEASEVRQRRGRERRDRFFRYWTLKEAYIKARGMGLALPLRRFSYTFPDPGVVNIEFDPEVGDHEPDWQFALYQPAPEHYLSAAIRRGDRADLRIVVRRSTALAREAVEVDPPRLVASPPSSATTARAT